MARPPVRLYCDLPSLTQGGIHILPRASAHYIATVMRGVVGDIIEVFNGRDGAWSARIVSASKNAVEIELTTQITPQESPSDIWLCAAPLKKGRIDWLAEKACELGVARLMPVITNRTIVDKLNTERLTAHMVEAAEQCGRTFVPPVSEPVKLAALLKSWPADRALLFCDETGGAPLPSYLGQSPRQPLGVLIGPEGGFDDTERAAIRAVPQAVAIGLGPRILRADTAAVAALSVIQALTGDWLPSTF
jgi:16S rRNA (uracil1498-N3)-methyltransferase